MRVLVALSLLLAAGASLAQQPTTVTYANHRYTVVSVDLTSQRLELFWRNAAGVAYKRFDVLDTALRTRGRWLPVAMNAGMFREDFSPVGLYVEHGKQLRALNLARGTSNFCLRPNGVFALTRSGAKIVESSQYPAIKANTLFATQSGPMLVLNGKLHPAFRATSTSRLIRNGVGVVSAQRVVLAIAEDPVNFHEFATFFRDRLKCPNALYLDGNVSALYAPAQHRNDQLTDLGPILGVTVPLPLSPAKGRGGAGRK